MDECLGRRIPQPGFPCQRSATVVLLVAHSSAKSAAQALSPKHWGLFTFHFTLWNKAMHKNSRKRMPGHFLLFFPTFLARVLLGGLQFDMYIRKPDLELLAIHPSTSDFPVLGLKTHIAMPSLLSCFKCVCHGKCIQSGQVCGAVSFLPPSCGSWGLT